MYLNWASFSARFYRPKQGNASKKKHGSAKQIIGKTTETTIRIQQQLRGINIVLFAYINGRQNNHEQQESSKNSETNAFVFPVHL